LTPPWDFALPAVFPPAATLPGGVHAAPTRKGALGGKYQNRACRRALRRGQDPALRPSGGPEQKL